MSYLKDFYREASKNKKIKLNTELAVEQRAGSDENDNLDFFGTFASIQRPELAAKLEQANLDRKNQRTKMLDTGLKQGMSWEDISAQTGTSLEEVKKYSETKNPNYGVSPPPPSNIDKGVGIAKSVGSAIVKPFETVGRGTTRALYGGVEEKLQAEGQAKLDAVREAALQKLRDPKTPDSQKKVILDALDEMTRKNVEQATQRTQQVESETDKKKFIGATAEATSYLFGGTGVTQAFKAGGKMAAARALAGTTASGALGGAGSAMQQEGSTLGDIAKGAALGAGIGAGAAVAGTAAGAAFRGAKGKAGELAIPTISETRLGSKIAQTKTAQKISNLKDEFVSKVVDNTNYIKKPFKDVVDSNTGRKVTDEIEALVTNVRQFASKAQDRLESNQSFQSLKPLIGGDKKAYKEMGEFINQKQDVLNHNKLIQSGERKGTLKTLAVGTPQQEEAYRLLNQATKDDIQYMFDNGIISESKYKTWMADDDYTRVQREVLDDQAQTFGGSGLGPKAKSISEQKLKGSTKKAVDPFASYEDWQRRVTLEIERNNLGKYVRDQAISKGITKPIRVADKVISRMELYGEAAHLRPLRNKLSRFVNTQNRYTNRIQSELDKLNRLGLDEYLKSKPVRPEVSLSSTSRVVRRGETDDALKALRSTESWRVGEAPSVEDVRADMVGTGWWNQATGKPTQRLQSYATKNKLSTDEALINQYMKKRGFDEYTKGGEAVILSKNKVNKKASEMIASGETSSQVLGVSSSGSRMTATKTRQAVENILEVDTSKLEAIRRKIANREPKLAKAMDELSAIKNEYDTVRTDISDLVKRATALSDLDSRGENTLKVFENGVKELYTIDPKMAKQLMGAADVELGAVADWVLLPSRILRGGATSMNAAFAVPNFIKDQIASGVISKNVTATHNPIAFWAGFKEAILKPTGKATLGRIPGVGKEMFQPSPMFKEYLARNGGMTRVDLARNLKQATRQAQENLGVRGEGVLRKYENMISASEKATRYQNFLGTYKNAVKNGVDPEDALKQASTAARTNSVNFSNRGEIGTFMKIFNPYFNAGIQGTSTLAKSIKNRPLGTSMKIGASIMAPVALSTYYNLGDPERAELYARIPDYERKNNIIMVLGGGRGYVKVPLPPGMKEFSNPLRNYVESEYLGDRQGFLETVKNIAFDPFSPVGTTAREALSQAIPQGIKPIVELGMNQDIYTGREIIPENMQGLNPEEQVYDSTPQSYKDIGKLVGLSPLQIRKVVTGYGAGGMEGALATVDQVRGKESGNRAVTEQIVKRFYGNAPGESSNQVTSKFYETYSPLRTKKESISKKITTAVKTGDIDKASKLAIQINNEIDKEKERLKGSYGRFESDLTTLYDQFDSLKFPITDGRLSDGSIKSRSKYK